MNKYEVMHANQAGDRAPLAWQAEKVILPLLKSIESKAQDCWLDFLDK